MKMTNEIETAWRMTLELLPKSTPRQTYDTHQVKRIGIRPIPGERNIGVLPELRFDDQCKNGHNTFSMTGTIYTLDVRGRLVREHGGGCCHESIAKAFPELKHLVKWHLVSTDGPLHYLANTCFLAGNRDCWGYAPGEPKEFGWFLRMPDRSFLRTPYPVAYSKRVVWRVLHWPEHAGEQVAEFAATLGGAFPALLPTAYGEGKKRELDAARLAAVWPEATDEELMDDGALPFRLIGRLPALMDQFKADMEAIGFKY